jgi:hypothetical protein
LQSQQVSTVFQFRHTPFFLWYKERMKTLFLLPILLLFLISTSCWSDTINDLVERDGIYYKKLSDIPFTGEVSGGEQDEIEWTPEIAGEWTHSYSNGEFLIKG